MPVSRETDPTRAFARRLPVAAVLALLTAVGLEFASAPPPLRVHFMACVLGLALALGAAFGSGLRALFLLIARLPQPLPYVVWPLGTLGFAVELALRLGAQKQLRGVYSGLAIAVIAGVTIACAGFSAILNALQPMRPGREASLLARGPRTRTLAALALGCAAIGLGAADRTLYVDLYPIAHSALRGAAVMLGTLAFALASDRLRLPPFSRRGAGLAILAGVLIVATLDERTPESLQALLARTWPRSLLSAARALADVDADGYASILGGGDCKPFDARVHPGAREVPDNGIDDNCALGDAHANAHASEAAPARPATAPSALDIVLITVDSLRRDRVGVYREPGAADARELTPALDAFARGATVFEHAYTPGGWTSLAVPALMRGVYPRRLRWTRFYETTTHRLVRGPLAGKLEPGESAKWLFAFPQDDRHPPLAQLLAAHGMTTLAVVDDGRSEILRPGTGFELGFDRYVEVNPGAAVKRDDMSTTLLAIDTLARTRGRQPVFLWVHFFGVHSPSERHPGVPSFGTSVSDRYDHEVRYFDRALERLLAAIALRGRRTAIFVTADHGEEFDRRVRYHGYSVDETVIAVPLVARVPDWPVRRVPELVSLIDLVPTILGLTGAATPGGLDGIDLTPALAEPNRARTLLSDTWRFDIDQRLIADFASAYDLREKLVLDELGYGALRSDKQKPESDPVLQFDPARDRLARLLYGYLEDTGGTPRPGD